MEGNSDVIWGFLDDLWFWHFNKISPFDPASKIYHSSSITPPRDSNSNNNSKDLK